MKSSGDSQRSSRSSSLAEASLVCVVLCLLVSAAGFWCFQKGYILYWGDAQAHLNSSRTIIDSLTPGYGQIGTPWLPLLHVICLPLVSNNWLWSTGLAGTIPVAVCFVIAGSCFYFAAKEAYQNIIAAIVVLACFALNPNVLYLGTIPMTEVVFMAGLAVLLVAMLRFRATQRYKFLALGLIASWAMSLTRYDGWFLIPFAALMVGWFTRTRPVAVFLVFAAAASLAPLYWMAHSWWQSGNPLDFYNGPYSAAAIQGDKPYPGYHNWRVAVRFYAEAARLCSGSTLVLLGVVGFVCAAVKRVWAPVLFLFLTPLFYIWAIHSSKNPIHVPMWFDAYYNTRYGIAVVVLCAFAAGAVSLILPANYQKWAALALPLFAALPWLIHPSEKNWICWKESQVNSVSRRAWTRAGADYLRAHLEPGQTILASTGDVTGIFCRAAIPLSRTVNIGNGPLWFAATERPDLFHPAYWAVAQSGDPLATAIQRQRKPVYQIDTIIRVAHAPDLEIFRRTMQ